MKLYKLFIVFWAVFIVTKAIGQNTNSKIKNGKKKEYLSRPLVTHIYTADPAAHVFKNRIYIYPSHDTATGVAKDVEASHYDMMDYHVLSMDSVGGNIIDHGVALSVENIAWAKKQLWAPDAVYINNQYYFYFPAKNKQNIFQIGVATSSKPEGPFVAEQQPIKGSYSIDPCLFKDDDGNCYMYFGGIKGGQLHKWKNNVYDSSTSVIKPDDIAVLPRIAKMDKGMKEFDGEVKEVKLVDSSGNVFFEKNDNKRFFEAAWVFKKDAKYYFTYSTGTTHLINYAIGNNPYGPVTYAGILLNPVDGWTNHQSIIQHKEKWYLFYHDTELSGENHLRNIKVTELKFNDNGTIQTITAVNNN